MADTIDELLAELLADETARHQTAAQSIHDRFAAYSQAQQLPPEIIVQAGDNLQGALDGTYSGAVRRIRVRQGTYQAGSFVVRSNTALTLETGAHLVGTSGPAVTIAPGTTDVSLFGGTSAGPNMGDGVVKIGRNDAAQAALDAVPRRIRIVGHVIPTHRGRCGFEVNGAEVTVEMCEVRDLYDPLRAGDQKGIWICNTPGPVGVLGGFYQAASENVLVGGSVVTLPGVTPSDLEFDGLTLDKPDAWRTAGIPVKNLFELKMGRRVTVRNTTGRGSWTSGQTGFALVVTPSNSNLVTDVRFEGNRWSQIENGLQLAGRNDDNITPEATRNVAIVGDRFEVNGGSGRLVQASQEAEDLTLDGVTLCGTVGSSLVYWTGGSVMGLDGVRRTALPPKRFTMRDSRLRLRDAGSSSYGLNFGGVANAANLAYFTEGAVVEANTLCGVTTMQSRLAPSNTWIDATAFAALIGQ